MSKITKVITRKNWEDFKTKAVLNEQSLIIEGFIHCSFLHQSTEVANKHFKNESDVMLLILNPELVNAEIKYELASNGEEYPHIYRPLNVDSVTEIVPFEKLADSSFHLLSNFK
jgi:uncharacterized protein (DUF952 family)